MFWWVYSSILCITTARQVANQLTHSLYYCCSRWAWNRKRLNSIKSAPPRGFHLNDCFSALLCLLISLCLFVLIWAFTPSLDVSFVLFSFITSWSRLKKIAPCNNDIPLNVKALFLIVKFWTLTFNKASDAYNSSGVVLRSRVTSWMSLSMHTWSSWLLLGRFTTFPNCQGSTAADLVRFEVRNQTKINKTWSRILTKGKPIYWLIKHNRNKRQKETNMKLTRTNWEK